MMSKKIILVITILIISFSSGAQKNVNDYKYVVVPLKFDFLKAENAYQLNEILEFLFNKYGYTAFLSNEKLPLELRSNPCMAMYADVKNLKGFLTTKLQIELKDCNGDLVFKSDEGRSKLKEYKKVFNVAMRDAFKSVIAINYKYNGVSETLAINESKSGDINQVEVERLKQEVQDLKKQKAKTQAELEAKQEAETKIKKEKELKNETSKIEISNETKFNVKLQVLYAQAVKEGFQLVNAEPKVVMVLLKTAAPNVFTVKGKDAIVFKQDDKWIYSENGSAGKFTEELSIKF